MKPDIEKLIEKYLKGTCSEEEREIVETWYSQLNEGDNLAAAHWKAKSKGLKSAVYKKIGFNDGNVRRLAFLRVAAAVLLLFLGSIAYLTLNNNDIDTKQALLAYAVDNQIEISKLKETRLILNQEKSIDLNGDAGIHYTKNELEIKDGSGTELIEKLETAKHAYNTLVVPYGRRVDIVLADGTRVWLNSGSRLVYPNAFKGDKREVFLQGEAFFDVAHNREKPFHVYAKEVDVKVLGTSFNVRAYSDEPAVKAVLVEGSVALSDAGNTKNKAHLTPGRMAIYETGKPFLLSNVNTEMYTSWKEGYLYLRNEPLQGLLKTIVRYYNVPIQIEKDQEERFFSGRLNLQSDIEETIEVIALTTGYTAEKTERGIIFRKNTNQM